MEISKCLIACTPMCTRQMDSSLVLYLFVKTGIMLRFQESLSEPVVDMSLTSLYDLKASFLFSVVTLEEVEKKSNRIRLTVNH